MGLPLLSCACTLVCTWLPVLVLAIVVCSQDVFAQDPNPYFATFGTAGTEDRAAAVTTDAEGAFYVLAYTNGKLFPTQQGSNDMVLMKFGPDSSHTRVWGRQFGSGNADSPFHVTLDHLGNPIVSGQTFVASAVLTKHSSAGAFQWSKTFGATRARGAAVDSNGNIFFVGTEVGAPKPIRLVKLTPTGNKIWEVNTDIDNADHSIGITVDINDNPIIFVEHNQGSQSYFLGVFKYNSNGVLQWHRTLAQGTTNVARGIASDSKGQKPQT